MGDGTANAEQRSRLGAGNGEPRLAAQYVYLIVAVAIGVTAVVLWIVASALWLAHVDSAINKGVIAILVGAFAAAFGGYLARSTQAAFARMVARSESRVMCQLHRINERLDQIEGLDQEAVQAARRIHMRLVQSDDRG